MRDGGFAKVAVARNAMATRFEVVLHGDHEPALRAAAEEALTEIQRIEAQLSLYRPDSEVAHLNARAASKWVRVAPEMFRLLERARDLATETGGAFDITVSPLMRCWGFMRGSGKIPTRTEIGEARKNVGMHLVELDPAQFRVRFARPGVMLDFGAIGKGYGIERAVEILQEAGIRSAIIHGGTSTVYGLGKPLDESAWKVAIEAPPHNGAQEPLLLSVVELCNEALSVSAVWGKSFTINDKTYGHIIDSRSGYPAASADLAAVALPSATETDALSTALLILGPKHHDKIISLRPDIRTLVMKRSGGGRKTVVNSHHLERE